MFNSIFPIDDCFNTWPDPNNTRDTDPGFASPLPDAGALLAAVGMPAHAIREVLGSRTYTGADG